MREQHRSVASHTRPNRGANPQPRPVPRSGIEPKTFQCTGQATQPGRRTPVCKHWNHSVGQDAVAPVRPERLRRTENIPSHVGLMPPPNTRPPGRWSSLCLSSPAVSMPTGVCGCHLMQRQCFLCKGSLPSPGTGLGHLTGCAPLRPTPRGLLCTVRQHDSHLLLVNDSPRKNPDGKKTPAFPSLGVF